MTLFPIFSRKIAYELERRGFKVIHMAPNRHNPKLQVYYFEETLALRNAAQELINKWVLDSNNQY